MRRRSILTGLAAVATLSLTALLPGSGARAQTASPASGALPIPMFVWTLTSFPGAGEISGGSYTIQFMPDGSVAIGADCNRAAGAWSGGDGALDITVTMQSLAYCGEQSLERPYLTALDGVTGYTLSGSTLVLHGAAGDLTFAV